MDLARQIRGRKRGRKGTRTDIAISGNWCQTVAACQGTPRNCDFVGGKQKAGDECGYAMEYFGPVQCASSGNNYCSENLSPATVNCWQKHYCVVVLGPDNKLGCELSGTTDTRTVSLWQDDEVCN
jgi:hypothetical protein